MNITELNHGNLFNAGSFFTVKNVFDLKDIPMSIFRLQRTSIYTPSEVRLVRRLREMKFKYDLERKVEEEDHSLVPPFSSVVFQFSEPSTKMATNFFCLQPRIPMTQNCLVKHDVDLFNLIESVMGREIEESVQNFKTKLSEKYKSFDEKVFKVVEERVKRSKRILKSILEKKNTRKVYFRHQCKRINFSELIVNDLDALRHILEYLDDIDLLHSISPSCSFFHSFVEERVKISFYVPYRFLVHENFKIERVLSPKKFKIRGLFFSSFDSKLKFTRPVQLRKTSFEIDCKSLHHHYLEEEDYERMKRLIESQKRYLKSLHFDHFDGIRVSKNLVHEKDLMKTILSVRGLERLSLRHFSEPLRSISKHLPSLKIFEFSVEDIICDPKDYYYEDFFSSQHFNLTHLNCMYRFDEDSTLMRVSLKWMRIKYEFNRSVVKDLKNLKSFTTNFFGVFEWDEEIIKGLRKIPNLCFYRMTGGGTGGRIQTNRPLFYPYEYDYAKTKVVENEMKFQKYIQQLLFDEEEEKKKVHFNYGNQKKRRRKIQFIYSPDDLEQQGPGIRKKNQSMIMMEKNTRSERRSSDVELVLEVSSEYKDQVGSSLITSDLFENLKINDEEQMNNNNNNNNTSRYNNNNNNNVREQEQQQQHLQQLKKFVEPEQTMKSSPRLVLRQVVYFDFSSLKEDRNYKVWWKLMSCKFLKEVVINLPINDEDNDNEDKMTTSTISSSLSSSIPLEGFLSITSYSVRKSFAWFFLHEFLKKTSTTTIEKVVVNFNSKYYVGMSYDILDIVKMKKKNLKSLVIRNRFVRRFFRKEKNLGIVPQKVVKNIHDALDENLYIQEFLYEGVIQ